MRNITSVFRKALYDGNRNYQCTAYITLLDNTELTITNARIAQGGVSLDDNVSDTSSFTALGSAIINALTLQINNIYEEYSAYDFTGASLVLYISLTGVQEQPVKICTMTVEKVSYDGMLITLECLDYMSKFDKPYTSTLIYPATLQSIINDACTECGVTLATTTFPNYTFEIATKPNNEALTYREVVSYVATLAGCFARCNSNGALELKWFDKNALIAIENTINGGVFDEDSPYSTGDSVNGGVFNPWNVGDEADGGLFTDNINAHYITALSSQNLGTDDVVITGVQITVENEVVAGEETRTDVITRTYGTDEYLIKIENNPFITLTNIDTIGTFLQNQLAGLTFRYGTISHLNDPSIEAGDVAMVWDRKGNAYPLLITNTQFKVGSYQTTTCSADTPTKNSATRFSALTKSFVQTKNVVRQESNSLETRLTSAINSKSGMYETREPVGTSGAYIYYLHDKPNLSESSAVVKITNEAVAVTPNYQQLPEPDWYGLTVDGTFISNLLQTTGISFDWARGGTLTLGGSNNQNGVMVIKSASGTSVGTWDKDGIWTIAGKIGGWDINSAQIRSDVTVGTTKYSAIMQSMDSSASTGRFAYAVVEYANNSTTYTDIPFRVNYDGSLLSTKGTIGGWTIGSSRLESTKTISGTIYNSYIQNMDGTDLTRGAFVLRNSTDGETTWNYPFLVRYNGEGRIGAWNFNATALYKGSSSYSSTTAGSAYIGDDGISFVNKSMRLYATGEHGATEYLARSQYAGLSLRVPGGDVGTVGVYCYSYQGDYTGWLIYYKSGSGAMIPQDLTVGGNIYADYGSISVIPQPIDNGANLNSFTTHGDFYYLALSSSPSITNYPSGAVISNFTLQVMKKGSQCNQILINNSGEMYYRNQFTSGWSAWRKVTAAAV